MASWVGQEGGDRGKAFPLAVQSGSFSGSERDVDVSVFTAGVVVRMGGDKGRVFHLAGDPRPPREGQDPVMISLLISLFHYLRLALRDPSQEVLLMRVNPMNFPS